MQKGFSFSHYVFLKISLSPIHSPRMVIDIQNPFIVKKIQNKLKMQSTTILFIPVRINEDLITTWYR